MNTPDVISTTGEIKLHPILPPTRKDLRRLLANGINMGWKRPFLEVLADLHKPLPDDYLKVKEAKNKKTGQVEKILYLDWHTCNMALDYVTPGWQIELRESQIGNRAIVTARITLLCEEGRFSRESTGSDDTDDALFGGFMPDAESQAMRRAAARFGLGLYLYDKAVAASLKRRLH